MSIQSEPSPRASRTMPAMVACTLIGLFALRVLTPAHEYPMRTEQVMTMIFDIFMLVGLIPLRDRVAPALFWTAIVAGAGSLVLRLTSDAAWWTGHLAYVLPPR